MEQEVLTTSCFSFCTTSSSFYILWLFVNISKIKSLIEDYESQLSNYISIVNEVKYEAKLKRKINSLITDINYYKSSIIIIETINNIISKYND